MKQSAGILVYRYRQQELEFFLVHPGGPFWSRKDAGAWTIPKGEPGEGEELLAAAQREFEEETGFTIGGKPKALTPVKQKGGKLVHAWAIEGNPDPEKLRSNTFELQWPPGSGKLKQFPEIDRAGWFNVAQVRQKLLPAQIALVEELLLILEKR